VAHEILALELLTLLLERPTDDSVEVAVSFVRCRPSNPVIPIRLSFHAFPFLRPLIFSSDLHSVFVVPKAGSLRQVQECGAQLSELSPRGMHAIFERFRGILHEGKVSDAANLFGSLYPIFRFVAKSSDHRSTVVYNT
jgi:pre-mRNA-splicing factor CWC22